jgi:signal transduction histidine kinase
MDEVRVLFIEDNPTQVGLIRQMLAKVDYPMFTMDHVSTLREGVERLQTTRTDLLLLDLSLGDSDGFKTFERAREAADGVPIVVLSGTDDLALARRTVAGGAQDYLLKGYLNHHWLQRALQYAMDRTRAQSQLLTAHAQLENRVAERTAELRETNERLQVEVDQRRRVEEALRESNRQLAEAISKLRETQQHIIQRERLHALGRMASGIAHDFNNKLAPILGFSELLLLKRELLGDHAKVAGYLEMIHQSAKDSAKVVNRLRDFYRYREDSGAFTPLPVNDLITQTIALMEPRWRDQAQALGNNIEITTDFEDHLPTISANEAELREMLTNVLFNAIEAIRGSGQIAIHTFSREGSAVVEIKDTGRGMTEEVLQRCLEPFFTTKDEQGSGFGLGIVYGVVRRHHGSIDIESELGKGTCVSISIPFHEDQPDKTPAPTAEVSEEKLSILVVDDEDLVREVIMVYLMEDNHEVVTAENGLDGLEKFKAGKFDVVLTDRSMPEMNGDQFALEVKQLDPTMPVILLTGFGDLMTDEGDRPPGIDEIVSKPFTIHLLREAITKATKGRKK